MGLLVPVRARVGRSGSKYILYIIDETDNKSLMDHLGRRVIAHVREVDISVRVTLSLNKSLRTPKDHGLPTKCV